MSKTIENLDIRSFIPSEFTKEDYVRLGLIDLVKYGYGNQGTEDELFEKARVEYGGNDETAAIYLAVQDAIAIGSLSVIKWKRDGFEERGVKFWNKLKELAPETYSRALRYSNRAFFINGIVVLPGLRRLKIAQQLMKKFAAKQTPAFVVGGSKTPEQVQARAIALSELDYRTFYGDIEITPYSQSAKFPEIRQVMEAFLYGASKPSRFYTSIRVSPNIPDISTFTPIINHAFQSLIEEQLKAGHKAAVLQPLISIKEEVIS